MAIAFSSDQVRSLAGILHESQSHLDINLQELSAGSIHAVQTRQVVVHRWFGDGMIRRAFFPESHDFLMSP